MSANNCVIFVAILLEAQCPYGTQICLWTKVVSPSKDIRVTLVYFFICLSSIHHGMVCARQAPRLSLQAHGLVDHQICAPAQQHSRLLGLADMGCCMVRWMVTGLVLFLPLLE